MKPYHMYGSWHVKEKTYIIDTFRSYPQGGAAWTYVDISGGLAKLEEGPLVLTSDWLTQRPSEEEKQLIIKAWFEQ
jgi:hypothetical protein